VLHDQRARDVAKRNPSMHRVRGQQAPGQRSQARGAQEAGELLEENRHSLLIAVGAFRSDRKHTEPLRTAVEPGNQMAVDLVSGKSLRLVRAEMAVGDEDGSLANGGVCNESRIDAYCDLDTNVLRVSEHEVTQIHAICRRGRNRSRLLARRRFGQDLVSEVERSAWLIVE